MPNGRLALSNCRYVRVTEIGMTSGTVRSVCRSSKSPVPRSTGSPSKWKKSLSMLNNAFSSPATLIIAPLNSQTRTPGSGTTCLPSRVTVPWP